MFLQKYKFIFVFILIVILTYSVLAASVLNKTEYEALQQNLSRDMEALNTFKQTGDINDFEKLTNELSMKWSSEDNELYTKIMARIVTTCSSSRFGEAGLDLMRKYAKSTLDKLNSQPEEKKVSLDVEFSFLNYIQYSLGESRYFQKLSQNQNWPDQRRSVLKYYLHGWERLEKTIDPNWDTNSKSVGPPMPPEGYRGPGAVMMSPDNIQDPVMRVEYEATLKAYWERQHKINEQNTARSNKRFDLPRIQRFILELYSGPMFESKNLDIDALSNDIAIFVKDEKIRKIIIQGMQNRLIEELKPKPERQGHPMSEND